jgi:hypothetical protein
MQIANMSLEVKRHNATASKLEMEAAEARISEAKCVRELTRLQKLAHESSGAGARAQVHEGSGAGARAQVHEGSGAGARAQVHEGSRAGRDPSPGRRHRSNSRVRRDPLPGGRMQSAGPAGAAGATVATVVAAATAAAVATVAAAATVEVVATDEAAATVAVDATGAAGVGRVQSARTNRMRMPLSSGGPVRGQHSVTGAEHSVSQAWADDSSNEA